MKMKNTDVLLYIFSIVVSGIYTNDYNIYYYIIIKGVL